MFRFAALLTLICAAAGNLPARAEDLPKLSIATQLSGTVNWELQTILRHGLDTENGFKIETIDMAGTPAAQIAFLGGEADVIVSDWIWVARQRAEGKDFTMIPYSKAVGGVMVPTLSPVNALSDFKGQQIGIAGGPVDKSWIIVRALAQKQGFDIAGETSQVFGAPPIIYKAGVDGEVAGVINFWNFMAKQKVAGMRELVSVEDAARQLGLDPDVPLLGYVFHGEMVRDHREVVAGFAAASHAAKDLLAKDDAAWDDLRPLMNADSDAEFIALRNGWRAGIPEPGPVDEAKVSQVLALMADLGGAELVGKATSLPAGVFAPLGY